MSDAADTNAAYQRRRWYEDPRPVIYCVVELKCDGGDPRRNSIRSLAAVAVVESGQKMAAFSVNLLAVEGAVTDKRTMELYREHPEAWRINTADPQRPSVATVAFATWVKSLPGQTVIVGSPLSLTAVWLDHYLRRFTPHSVYRGPFVTEPLFYGPGLDLSTLVMGVTGRHYRETPDHLLPVEWRGGQPETHRAADDANRHAELLCSLLKLKAQQQAL